MRSLSGSLRYGRPGGSRCAAFASLVSHPSEYICEGLEPPKKKEKKEKKRKRKEKGMHITVIEE
jgi:hypothetical protein